MRPKVGLEKGDKKEKGACCCLKDGKGDKAVPSLFDYRGTIELL